MPLSPPSDLKTVRSVSLRVQLLLTLACLRKLKISGTHGTVVLAEEDIVTWEFDPELPEDAEIREKFAQKTDTGGGASDPRAD